MKERPAHFLDTIGRASKQLFARHKETKHRISAGRFYKLSGFKSDCYQHNGYVLMTTRAERPTQTPSFL